MITPGDILAAYPKIWPFPHNYSSAHARPLPQDCKIAAIMMFSNPLDWGPVLQIVIDLLLSQNGQLGTRSAKNGDSTLPNSGYLLDGQPMIYFSGSDLCWTSEYPVPRFGFGSFRVSIPEHAQANASSMLDTYADFNRLPLKAHGEPIRARTSNSTPSSSANHHTSPSPSPKQH